MALKLASVLQLEKREVQEAYIPETRQIALYSLVHAKRSLNTTISIQKISSTLNFGREIMVST